MEFDLQEVDSLAVARLWLAIVERMGSHVIHSKWTIAGFADLCSSPGPH